MGCITKTARGITKGAPTGVRTPASRDVLLRLTGNLGQRVNLQAAQLVHVKTC